MGSQLVLTADGLSVRLVQSDGTDLHQGASKWVRLDEMFQTKVVPVESAAVIELAMKKMLDAGLLSPDALWQFIEFLAADWLATPDLIPTSESRTS